MCALQVCLKSRDSLNKWYLDSGCSKHMTGDRTKFRTFTPKESGFVTIGDNSKRKILGVGSVGMTTNLLIENVLLVDSLNFNLLSISQLCAKTIQ